MNDLLRYSNHCGRLMQCSMQPLRTELGISQLEADLLLFLRNNPELNTARDAVTYRGFAKSNVSTAVESLKKKGWLSVEPDPSSRRIKRLVLRSEKETDIQRLADRQAEVFQMLCSGFAPDEIEQLRSFLARMDENAVNAFEKMEEERNNA